MKSIDDGSDLQDLGDNTHDEKLRAVPGVKISTKLPPAMEPECPLACSLQTKWSMCLKVP